MNDDERPLQDTDQQEAESLHAKLAHIQSTLEAPKGQFNKFGGYKYRSCEDILRALKPLLGSLVVRITDDIVLVGDRFYVKATATITNGRESISTVAFAREPASKKGADESQITGAASSYARKYALNGLLAIDDTKDADATNEHGKGVIKATGGVYEKLPENERRTVDAYVQDIKEHMANDDVWGAYESAQGLKDADIKVAVWSFLDSKTRSALKHMKKEEKEKELTNA